MPIRIRVSDDDERVAARSAPVVAVAYCLVAFFGRMWLQRRSTGDSGFRLSLDRPLRDRIVSSLIGGGALVAVVGAVRWARSGRADPPTAKAGLALMDAAFAGTLKSQSDMGRSWRIGVDSQERTDLVTTGVFSWSRNPIYACMVAFAAGLTAAAPDPVTAIGAAVLTLGVQLQARVVEEPYLLRMHGDAYRSYMGRVGRFLPGLGRGLGGA